MELNFLSEGIDYGPLSRIMKDENIKIESCIKRGTYAGVLEWNIMNEMEMHSLQMEELTTFHEEVHIFLEDDKVQVAPTDAGTQKTDVKKSFGSKLSDYFKKAIDFAKKVTKNFGAWIANFGSFAKRVNAKFAAAINGKSPTSAPKELFDTKIQNGTTAIFSSLGNEIKKAIGAFNTPNANKALGQIKVTLEKISKDIETIGGTIDAGVNATANYQKTTVDQVANAFAVVDNAFQPLSKALYDFNAITAKKIDEAQAKQTDQQNTAFIVEATRVKQTISNLVSKAYNNFYKLVKAGYNGAQQAPQQQPQQQQVNQQQTTQTANASVATPAPAPAPNAGQATTPTPNQAGA